MSSALTRVEILNKIRNRFRQAVEEGLGVVGFTQALLTAARGGLCDLADVSGRLLPTNYYPVGSVLQPAQEALRNFLSANFCDKPPLPPSFPFTGGQCENLNYTIRAVRLIRRWGNTQDQLEPSEGFAVGPILSISPKIINSGGGIDVIDLVAVTPTQEYRVGGAVNVYRSFFPNGPRDVRWSEIEIIPPPGVPDDCGDPPYQTQPYNPDDFTFNTIIEYNDNSGNTFNIPLTFVVGVAFFNADLDLIVPIDVSIDPTFNANFNGTFNFGVEFNLTKREERVTPPRPVGTPPTKPPLPPSTRPDDYETPTTPPTPPPDAPNPPPASDDTPKVRVIKAALVTVVGATTSGKVGTLFQGDNPDIALPNFGYINFLCRAGNLSGGWTPDQPVKNGRCFIPCPWEGGAFDVKGTPQPGIQFVITPVYSKIPVSV